MSTWQFHLLNWQGVCPVWTILVSFVYAGSLVWAFLQSHKINLTYCFKSSLLLESKILSVCLYNWSNSNVPPSISPLGLLQEIICSVHSVSSPYLLGLDFWKIIEEVSNFFCKSVCLAKSMGTGKKYKKWGWPLRRGGGQVQGVYRRGVQTFCKLWYWETERGDLRALNYWRDLFIPCKDKHISRWVHWENLIYVTWNNIKNQA